MSKVLVSSDYHLGHGKINFYASRPYQDTEKANNFIITNHNMRVKPEDTFLHIGDFCFKSGPNCPKADYWLSKLNGHKIMIRGNHDNQNSLKTIIDSLQITFAGRRMNLTHIPENSDPSVEINLVGHVHCFDQETELLTSNGWKKYSELKLGEKIISLNIKTNKLVENPIREIIIDNYVGDMVDYNSNHKFTVTPNHRIYYKKQRNKHFRSSEIQDLLKTKNSIFTMKSCGELDRVGLPLSDDEIKLCVWICADGSIAYRKGNVRSIRFKLSKERKITRLVALLTKMGLKFSINKAQMASYQNLQPYRINLLNVGSLSILGFFKKCKELPSEFRGLSKEQVGVLLEEYSHTDGTKYRNTIQISTSKKHEADLLQEMFVTNGYSCKICTRKFDGRRNQNYTLSIGRRRAEVCLRTENLKLVPYNGVVWCVNVENDTVLTRKQGTTFISHNSAWRIRSFKQHYDIIENVVNTKLEKPSDRQDFVTFLEKRQKDRDRKSIILNVGLDVQKYRPVTLDEALYQVQVFKKENNL